MVIHGSSRKVAKAMGVNKSVINRAITAVKRKAAARGFSPRHDMVHTVPEGFAVKGTSTLYTHGEDGQKVAAQWVKTNATQERAQEALEAYVAELTADIPARAKAKPPKPSSGQVLSAYIYGDPHCGLYAFAPEAGENYDLKRWSEEHRAAMVELVASAPESDEAILVNLGDFVHADTDANRTKSGHELDVDGRHTKVFQEGCRTFEFMIDEALRKHQRVTVYITRGNHDEKSSFALAEVLRAVYRKEDRVTIKGGIAYREYHQFGCNLIGITHGDKAKPAQLSQVMAAEKPAEWGAATCRRWLVGHFHHQDRKEYPGCIVEIFPTLARNDAWHSGMGYLSEKAMTCIVFDKDHGEKGRRIVGIRELTA
jgi:hypothetical protein